MNTYKNVNYEIKPWCNNWQQCICTLNGENISTFTAEEITDNMVHKEIDSKLRSFAIENYIRENIELVTRLANTYEDRAGYGSWKTRQARHFINKNYTEDHAVLTKKIYKTVVSRENSKLSNTIDHMTDMSMIEFRRRIETLTERKVCVNGGKAYLHIYNWLYKGGKKTRYRTDHYYISVGQNMPRTEENAQMIATKCLEFAKIENYGNKVEIPVEKF